MIIFMKANGEIAFVSQEEMRRGSIKANSLTLVAPFDATNVITVAFTLPNGVTLGPGLVDPTKAEAYRMSCLSESFPAFEGTDLNVWHYELEQNVTSVPGTLTIQFFITTSDGETIPTEAFTKHVATCANSGAHTAFAVSCVIRRARPTNSKFHLLTNSCLCFKDTL